MSLKPPGVREGEQRQAGQSQELGQPREACWTPRREGNDLETKQKARSVFLKAIRPAPIALVALAILFNVLELPLELVGVFFVEVLIVFGIAAARQVTKELSDLPDDYWQGRPWDGVHDWAVSIDIVQRGVRTGTDAGMLWVQRGAIHFVGKRTSFVLGKRQLADEFVAAHIPSPVRPLQRSVEVRLADLGDLRDWSVHIDPHASALSGRLVSTLEELADGTEKGPVGQFPPRCLGPGPLRKADILLAAITIPSQVSFAAGSFTILGVAWLGLSLFSGWNSSDGMVLMALLAGWLPFLLEQLLFLQRIWRNQSPILRKAASLSREGSRHERAVTLSAW